MSQAIIPLKGSGFPKLTAKTVMFTKEDAGSGKTEEVKQNYVDRIRGYIPVEVVAFYVFVNSLISDNVFQKSEAVGNTIDQATNQLSLTADGYVAVIATILGIIGTTIYVRTTAKDNGIAAWKISCSIAVVAFIIWVYAMDAKIFDVLKLEVIPSVSGLLLASFTLFVGIIVPTTKNDTDKSGELV